MGFSAGLAVAAVVGVASAAASGAFNKVPSAPPPPPPPAPAPMPMPTMDSDAVLAAQKKQAQIAENESGRASTILSTGSGTGDKLG
jgi:hypothetical protein